VPDPVLAVLRSDTFGQGKSTAAMEAAAGLAERGFSLGGITFVPVYRSRDGALVGFEAHILSTGQRVLVGHNARTEWPVLHFQQDRRLFVPEQVAYGSFHADDKAMQKVERLLADELKRRPDVFILDDLGPFLASNITRGNRARHPVVDLVRGALAQPCPITVVVFGQRQLQYVDLQACQRLLQQSPLWLTSIQIEVRKATWRAAGTELLDRLLRHRDPALQR
jgi:nucleoside-triphosphatase THEP1